MELTTKISSTKKRPNLTKGILIVLAGILPPPLILGLIHLGYGPGVVIAGGFFVLLPFFLITPVLFIIGVLKILEDIVSERSLRIIRITLGSILIFAFVAPILNMLLQSF